MDEQQQADVEFLEELLTRTSKQVGFDPKRLWYGSDDVMLRVANLLEDECYLRSASDAIRFFEKPYHFESDMRELIDTLKGED